MKNNDQQFRDLMKSYQSGKAPVDFTRSVMEQIKKEESVVSTYQPVFGKWFFRGMVAALGLLFIYGIFGSFSGPESTVSSNVLDRIPRFDMSGFSGVKNQLADLLGNIPSVVGLTLLAATLLLLLDVFVLKKNKLAS